MEAEATELFAGLPEDLKARCRRAFAEARQEPRSAVADAESETGSSPEKSTSNGPGTRDPKSGAALASMTILRRSDPAVCPATRKQIDDAILRLGFSTGHVVHVDRVRILVEDIARAGWTEAELDLASALIPADRELMKEINFARTINSGVFMLAKDRPEVVRGRLFTHGQMRAYCAEHQITDDAFEVVRVEGDLADDGTLRPWWRLK